MDRTREMFNEAIAKESTEECQKTGGSRKYSRRVDSTTGVESRADITRFRPDKKTCTESSDNSCEEWQLTDRKQPCSGRRVMNGCRGRRERRIQKFESTEHQETNNDEAVKGRVSNG